MCKTGRRAPATEYLLGCLDHVLYEHCLHIHKRADGPEMVRDMPSTRAGCRKDGAGGKKNQHIFTVGAGRGLRGGCRAGQR